MLERHSEGPCLQEIPAEVGLGDVSCCAFASFVLFFPV